MIALVKTVHILALVLALGAGLTRLTLGRVMATQGEARPYLGPIMARFTNLNYLGLILLWISGLALVALTYSSTSLGWAFHVKMVAVVAMTAIAATGWVQAKRGKPFPPKLSRPLGQATVALAVSAVLLATLAFS